MNLKQQRGVGLLEVLVAILILAVGVLGFSALQVRAVSSTSEGFARAQAMGSMRMLAESMRTNPTALNTYIANINTGSVTPPGKTCMGNNTGSEVACTADQLAVFDSYQMNLTTQNQDLNLRLLNCPGLLEARQCIVTAWGKTNPTVGANPDSDCLKADGTYHRKATCLLLEAI